MLKGTSKLIGTGESKPERRGERPMTKSQTPYSYLTILKNFAQRHREVNEILCDEGKLKNCRPN